MMKTKARAKGMRIACWAAAAVVATRAPASANIGVPMAFVVMPAAIVLLPAIIVLEAAIGWRVAACSFGRALRTSTLANLVSTLAGVPLTWGALALPQVFLWGGAEGLETRWQRIFAVTVQSPWLIPYEGDLHWMVPAAAMTLCLFFFFASVWVEYLVIRRLTPDVERRLVGRWAWLGNVASYALLEIVLLVILLIQLSK